MRITRLVLKNWGPHAALDLDMDTPVFGLLGPNASGKSNIMSAISFGFTGLLEYNQASYVRTSANEEISNGSVDLYFVKGGIKGRIFRQVGKSPSRKLWWEDWSKPYTKAAEIDKLMSQILDCDKQAIDQAVFLSQGHLADFLSGTPTQREEDFSRMCLIDRLSIISDIAAQEIVRLSKTVTDLTSQRDEALLTKDQAIDALRTTESELELHPDRTPQLEWLHKMRGQAVSTLEAETQCQTRLAALTSAKERLSSVLCPFFSTSEQAEADHDSLNRELSAALQDEHKLQTLNLTWSQQQTREARLKQLRSEVASILAQAPRITQLQSVIQSANERLVQYRDFQAWQTRMNEWKQQRDSCDASIVAGEGAMRELESESSVAQRLEESRQEMERLAGEKFRLSLAEQVQGHVQDCCPLCRGKDLSGMPSGAELEKLKQRCDSDYASSQQIHQEASQAQVKRARYQERLDALRLQKKQLSEKEPAAWAGLVITSAEADAAQREGPEATAELAAIQASLATVPKLNAEINDLATALESKLTEEDYTSQARAMESSIAKLPDLRSKVALLANYLRDREAWLRAVEAAQLALDTTAASAEQAREQRSAVWRSKPGALLIESYDIPVLDEVIAQTKNRQAEREKVQGMIRANTDALRRAENRVEEIEQRARQNAATMSVIGHLEELKNAFGRHGVPRHYLSKVFDALLTGTQENLAEWDTDFQVEKDPNSLFNFQFYRTDDPDTLMDQNQLSGGQKTRLALSFVQAVQRLLYPGLDFLCVDEPSNHLDAEGVEGLARLFQTIAQQNQDGEAQVIVVDHHPLLHRAFSKSVTLTRLRNTEAA